MRTNKNYLKYIAFILVLIFLISAGMIALELWEKREGRFSGAYVEDGVLTYEGKEYVLRGDVETILVMGLDKFSDQTSSDSHNTGSTQADFLMLLVFDNTAKQCSAIQINRDTMANVNRLGLGGVKIGSAKEQIALAYNYTYDDSGKISCRNTADAVSELLMDIDVTHYMSMTMDAVPILNDLVGGVELVVRDDFTGIDDTLVKGQKVTLRGEQALRYIRTRKGLEDSTNSTRMLRQQQYVEALYEEVMSRIKSDENSLIELIGKMDEYMVYDSTEYRMKEMAEKFDMYEFLGIREIEGEQNAGEKFMEFYPNEDSILSIVIDLFYMQKK